MKSNQNTTSSTPMLFTIKQIARQGILPEYTLRQLRCEGRLPGIQLNAKYLVNRAALIERIENGTL